MARNLGFNRLLVRRALAAATKAHKELWIETGSFIPALVVRREDHWETHIIEEIPSGDRTEFVEGLRRTINKSGWKWYSFISDATAVRVNITCKKLEREDAFEAILFIEGTKEGEEVYFLPYQVQQDQTIRWKPLRKLPTSDGRVQGAIRDLGKAPAPSSGNNSVADTQGHS